MSSVRAVLISDVHFNIKTLALASASLRAALTEARDRKAPLIIAGDLNDTKAIMRGECVNAIIEVMEEFKDTPVIVLVGNHDLINEKATAHTLNFLRPYATIVEDVDFMLGLCLIPYQHSVERLREILSRPEVQAHKTLIMHQGIMGAAMGEYVVDKSSIRPDELANFRVITGHYHRHQEINCDGKKHASPGEVGLAHYIGTPYTVTFTEANDGPKGIQLLMGDGRLQQVPLYLRRHVIRECRFEDVMKPVDVRPEDLLWLKVSGPASELDKLKKKAIGLALIGHENFKFDRIYDQADAVEIADLTVPPEQMFDKLIDESEETSTQKTFLKDLWRRSCV